MSDNETLPQHIEALPPLRPVPRFLEGQKALVTGASSGIGKAVAIALGQAGADVAANYAGNPKGAEEVVAAVEAAGGRGLAVRADVSHEDQVEAMMAETVGAFGTIDILVANAGLTFKVEA